YKQLYPERGNKFKVLKIIHLRLHLLYEEELGNLNLYKQLYPERGNKFKVLKIIHLRLHLLYEEE
ncbi:hypothetical protein CYJ57_03680, partial [Falseniella ignava]